MDGVAGPEWQGFGEVTMAVPSFPSHLFIAGGAVVTVLAVAYNRCEAGVFTASY